MNKRRRILSALGLGALLPGRAAAQPTRVFRVGWISPDRAVGSPFMEAFVSGLRDLGYVPGHNLVLDERWGEGSSDQIDRLAAELVRSKPDVIVTQGGTTSTVVRARPPMPVVFGFSGDPIEAGYAQSLARPGGNFTGMSFLSFQLVGKRMAMLKEVMPGLKQVAILANPQHPGEQGELKASLAAAKQLGITTQYFPARSLDQMDEALGAILKSRSQAMDVFPDSLTMRNRERIAKFAADNRIPTISGWARFADGGNLLSYGPNLRDVYRRLAVYVDKVLKGTRPADIPIELPTAVELVVNLRAAKALDVRIPQTILVRANRVIE